MENRVVSEAKSAFDKEAFADEKLHHGCLLGLLEDIWIQKVSTGFHLPSVRSWTLCTYCQGGGSVVLPPPKMLIFMHGKGLKLRTVIAFTEKRQ